MQSSSGPKAIRVNPRQLSQSIAFLGFILLYPGFVVYQFAVASGWIPPLLGGLFGIVSLAIAMLCVLMLSWLTRAEVWGGLWQARLVLFAWCFFLAWIVAGYLGLIGTPYAGAALAESLATMVIWLAAFFVGSFCRVEGNVRRALFGASVVAVVLVLVGAIIRHQSLLGLLLTFGGEENPDLQVSTYQGVGRSILVMAMVLAALTPQYWKQLSVLSVAALVLLGLGSRAHLFTTIILIVAIVLLSLVKARRRAAVVVFLVFAVVAVRYGWSVFLETRAGEILDLGQSTSWAARLDMQELAIRVIRHHPLLGDFGYHLRDVGPGGYAHNALSAWTQFGLMGFLLFSSLIVYFAGLSVRKVLSPQGASATWRMAFQINVAALILAITAEPVFSSVFPALGWGFAVNALLEERGRRTVVQYA
jgi:hypothetical protein